MSIMADIPVGGGVADKGIADDSTSRGSKSVASEPIVDEVRYIHVYHHGTIYLNYIYSL